MPTDDMKWEREMYCNVKLYAKAVVHCYGLYIQDLKSHDVRDQLARKNSMNNVYDLTKLVFSVVSGRKAVLGGIR